MKRKNDDGPGEDGEEHDSSPSSSPGTGNTGPDPAGSAKPQQRPRGKGQPGGFADGGPADVLAPGAELAELLAAATGNNTALKALTDQEILGLLAAWDRMAAWASWGKTAVLAEFAARRPGAMSGSKAARQAAEEAAWKTTETWTQMLDQLTHAATLTARLPRTLAAMRGGQVSERKARIIEAQTAELSDADVAKADMILAAAGQSKNPAGLRDFARRQVARLDPEAAARRKERARQDAYVRIWEEDSGNAGLSARQMPAADAVMAWQNIEQRALDLHAAGVDGTAGQLQVQATLDFLLGRATPGQDARPDAHDDADEDAYSGTHVGEEDESARQDTHRVDDEGAYEDTHVDEDGNACEDAHDGACEDTHKGGRGGGRGGWVVNPVLVVPWDPSLGRPSGPAELPGFGLLDEQDTLDLLAAAGDNPANRWCLTVQGQDGAAVAHGCIPGRRTLQDITSADTAAGLATQLGVTLTPVTTGACQHAHAEPGYKPSCKLRHLIQARNTRCAAPGCVRPAAACDLDHTLAWEDGGVTCQCNLAPLCRAHHQIKQAQGWKLEQTEPGVLVWGSPSGLTRTTTPSSYKV